ncbi:MAG: beta-aspartyl-peptidase [Tissierellia bacterium]|nr:beta-aspartyl-peptidase [Tissierellia bacterium]
MIIIKSADIYSPKYIGKKDIFIGADKILYIDDDINLKYAEIFDAHDKIIIPGLIDQHVHITGGGGEGGFNTKVPEAQLSSFIKAGITTVVGLLGTDSTSRSVENLLSKAKALNAEGITSYALTGAYEIPSPTITGSVKRDISFIEEIIGVKIAVNDHRDSAISPVELAKLATEARVAGMFSGKSGHVTVHMGGGKFDLNQIYEALEISNLPIGVFRPTHINRKKSLCLKAIEFVKKGGYMDITCSIPSDISDTEIINLAIQKQAPLSRITFSSDGYGSWSEYDEFGNLIEIGVTPIDSLLNTISKLSKDIELEKIIPLFTSNVADSLKISDRKGYIKKDYDADLLILNSDLSLNSVIAKGKWLMKENKILKYGTYEKSL